jgi:prepilin-type N-terminal cleavage/methylation domain-containing protein
MLRSRPGFTLAEVLIALVLTGIIGAAVTSVFITQAAFYDRQDKISSARGVSRGAMNVLLSELRMLEQVQGVDSATSSRLVLRVPYIMGVTCGMASGLVIRYIPTDTIVLNENVYSGYAWRNPADGVYQYRDISNAAPTKDAGAATCTSAGVADIPNGGTLRVHAGGETDPVEPGLPVFLYMRVVYEFRNSAEVPGQRALWRRTVRNNRDEELVAPFSPHARFRFYIDDSAEAVDDPPTTAQLHRLTGIEIVLDGLSERPSPDGTRAVVPYSTSIFFKNRL